MAFVYIFPRANTLLFYLLGSCYPLFDWFVFSLNLSAWQAVDS